MKKTLKLNVLINNFKTKLNKIMSYIIYIVIIYIIMSYITTFTMVNCIAT